MNHLSVGDKFSLEPTESISVGFISGRELEINAQNWKLYSFKILKLKAPFIVAKLFKDDMEFEDVASFDFQGLFDGSLLTIHKTDTLDITPPALKIECTCDIHVLMNRGCQCDALDIERRVNE